MDGEEIVVANLAHSEAFDQIVSGIGSIFHFDGTRLEASLDQILQTNITGSYNVFNAAKRHGVRHIVYASSVHAIGFYPTTQRIDSDVSAVLRHLLWVKQGLCRSSRLYAEKAVLKFAYLRIGTELKDLSTYLRFPALLHLIVAVATRRIWPWLLCRELQQPTQLVGHLQIWRRLPADDSEAYADRFAQDNEPDPEDRASMLQGGHLMPPGFRGGRRLSLVSARIEQRPMRP